MQVRMAPLIIAERRIILFLVSFIAIVRNGAVYLPPLMSAKQLLSSQWWRCTTRAKQQNTFIILHKE